MIKLNQENFNSEVLGDGLTIVIFHRETGCSNCEKMMPLFKAFSELNKDIKCAEYVCGSTQDEITSKYLFRIFPAIFYFLNGKFIGVMEGVNTPDSLYLPLMSPVELKSMIYDQKKIIEQAEIAKINIQALEKVLQSKTNIVVPKQALPDIIDPADETICDGCQ